MDPIANLINTLKHAAAAGKGSALVPYSKLLFAIAEWLRDAGYLESVSRKSKKPGKPFEVRFRYGEGGASAIAGVKRLSKPSKRIYRSARELRPTRQGIGTVLVSTPKGILTHLDARRAGVGGEPLFEIW